MKASILGLIALGLCSSLRSQAADSATDAWKGPILSAIGLSANTAMTEYEFWAKDWKKGKRQPENSDYSMNLMTETTLIAVQYALAEHPNPRLLEKCLTFLGTQVQPEFDYMWKARILEMAYLDKAVTNKVNAMLKAKHLPSLEELAMSPSGGKGGK